MSTRLTSGMVGVIAVSVTIYLESHGHIVAGQCFIWSILAMAAPVAVAVVTDGKFLTTWFWVAALATATFHGLLMWKLWEKFPLPSAAVAIVFGFVEAFILIILSAKIREWVKVDKVKL